MEPDRLVVQFESLGDSCEFGLVQRHAGAEPLGLLRFAGFTGAVDRRLEDLVAALDRGFEGLGEPDTVQVTMEGPAGHHEYIVRESVYGLLYHTFLGPTDVSEAALRRNESVRLRFLRRKLLADLAAADKIFVWKSNLPVEPARIHRLLAALRRHGPARLLWVCAADNAPGPIGSVEHLADGLLRGVVDRFAPYERMTDISHDAWRAVCAAALQIAGSSSEPDETRQTIAVSSLRELVARAAADPSVGGMRGASVLSPPGRHAWRRPLLQDTTFLDPALRDTHSSYYAAEPQEADATLKVVLERALVTTHGAVITQDGHLLRESCWELLEAGLVPHGLSDLGESRFRFSAPVQHVVHEPALLLKRPWWRSYRHFLIETAGLLAFAATRLDVTELLLITGKEEDPALRQAMLDLLAMLAPGARLLEHPDDELWRFSDLHYITPVHVPPLFKLPEALSALRSAAQLRVGEPQAGPKRRRLYLVPGATEPPALDNAAEIVAVCGEFGFEPIRLEQHSIAERIALFRDAEAVVGVKTPRFADIVFCDAPCLVLALSPGDWPDPFYADIAGHLGLRYVEIFGALTDARHGPAQNPFRIEPDALRQALASLLADAGQAAALSVPTPPPRIAFEAFAPVVSYPDHQGEGYLQVLDRLHRALRPRGYLEIGTQHGEALSVVGCPAVVVDPHMLLSETVIRLKRELFLFRMSSEAFFERHDPTRYLSGPVDLAFLDGPNLLFEIVLRDFINVERHASRRSVVLIHDVVPPEIYMAGRDLLDDFHRSRSSHPTWWSGDVWKVVGVLQEYRPDLTIDLLDASPTGLALIQGLDSASRILAEQYDRIVAQVAGWPSEVEAFAAYRAGLRLRRTAELPTILAQRA